jgi:hypothetical protein
MADTQQASTETSRTIVIDLGKKKRKQVKKLRKGRGRLAALVTDTVAELRAAGEAGAGDTIVVVVEKKSRRFNGMKW